LTRAEPFRNVTITYVGECLYLISRLMRRVLFVKCPQESPCVLTSVELAIEMVRDNVDVIYVVQIGGGNHGSLLNLRDS
jgi:hypothetical protein